MIATAQCMHGNTMLTLGINTRPITLLNITQALPPGALFFPDPRLEKDTVALLAKTMKDDTKLYVSAAHPHNIAIEIATHITPMSCLYLDPCLPEITLTQIARVMGKYTNLFISAAMSAAKRKVIAEALNPNVFLILEKNTTEKDMLIIAQNMNNGGHLCLHSSTTEENVVAVAESMNNDTFLCLQASTTALTVVAAAAHMNHGSILCLDPKMAIADIIAAANVLNSNAFLYVSSSDDDVMAAITAAIPMGAFLYCPNDTRADILPTAAKETRPITSDKPSTLTPKNSLKRRKSGESAYKLFSPPKCQRTTPDEIPTEYHTGLCPSASH